MNGLLDWKGSGVKERRWLSFSFLTWSLAFTLWPVLSHSSRVESWLTVPDNDWFFLTGRRGKELLNQPIYRGKEVIVQPARRFKKDFICSSHSSSFHFFRLSSRIKEKKRERVPEGNEGISTSLSHLPSVWWDKYILFLLWLTLIFFYSSRINEDAALQRRNRKKRNHR